MDENKKTIIKNVDFQDVQAPKSYTIKDIAQKLDKSPTKINHLIFKLSKRNGDKLLFSNAERFTEEDIEKIQLALALIDDGKTYDEVITYLLNEDNGMSEDMADNSGKEVVKLNSKRMTKEIMLEINKQLIQTREQMIQDLSTVFGEETKKLAQTSLIAINQTKDVIMNRVGEIIQQNNSLSDDNNILLQQNNELIEQNRQLKDIMSKLIEQNNIFKDELERQCNKSTENLRRKLQLTESQLQDVSNKLENEKNKSIWSKIFNK